MAGRTPPKYDLAVVEAALLEVAADLHPEHLAPADLLRRIVADPDDRRELATARRAISNLTEFGLIREREDGRVTPTQFALRAIALLG